MSSAIGVVARLVAFGKEQEPVSTETHGFPS